MPLASAGTILLLAGKDLQLATVTTQSSHQAQWAPGNALQESQQQDLGSQISSQGKLYLQAGVNRLGTTTIPLGDPATPATTSPPRHH